MTRTTHGHGVSYLFRPGASMETGGPVGRLAQDGACSGGEVRDCLDAMLVRMAGMVEIHDARVVDTPGNPPPHPRGTVLAFDLTDLLMLVAPEGQHLTWSILDLWATVREPKPLPEGKDYLDLEAEIARSPKGLIVEWNQLIALAEAFLQVIDGVFVGCTSVDLIPPRTNRLTVEDYAACELVLEALDSTLWTVYARDDAVVHRIRSVFRDVRVVDEQAFRQHYSFPKNRSSE